MAPLPLGAVGALLFNAAVWGGSWWPLRELQAAGLHPLWATAAVYAIGLSALGLLLWRSWAELWKRPLLWLLGCMAGLTNVGFNWAVTEGDVVRIVLLFYLMPVWSALLAWWLLDDRPNAWTLGRITLALLGVLLVLYTPAMGLPWPQGRADWLGLGAGACFALTNILLLKGKDTPESARMLAMFVGAGSMSLILALLGTALGWSPAPTSTQGAWLGLAALLALAFIGGNLALQYGAARLPASVTALVMLSEILFATVSSVAMGAAQPGARTWLGGGMIVLASVLAIWSHRPRRQETP